MRRYELKINRQKKTDFKLKFVSSKRNFQYVRQLNDCCKNDNRTQSITLYMD